MPDKNATDPEPEYKRDSYNGLRIVVGKPVVDPPNWNLCGVVQAGLPKDDSNEGAQDVDLCQRSQKDCQELWP